MERLERGVVAVGLPEAVKLTVIEGLSDPETDFVDAIERAFPDIGEGGTMFVLVDGFSRRISALIDALFEPSGSASTTSAVAAVRSASCRSPASLPRAA